MFVTRKYLFRRALLRGTSASLALRLLDPMARAQTPLRRTAASHRSRVKWIVRVADDTPEGLALP